MKRTVALPVLATHLRELETCGYCPKLCRAKCPVAAVEPRETLTPWGMMSQSWLVLRGASERTRANADPAWACTGCYRCRTGCDHQNPVYNTLLAVRSELARLGLAPAAVAQLAQQAAARRNELSLKIQALQAKLPPTRPTDTALLVGCLYTRRLPEVAEAVVRLARFLIGPIRLVQSCCGMAQIFDEPHLGIDPVQALRNEIGNAPLIVADPGCARHLSTLKPTLLVTQVARELGRFSSRMGRGGEWLKPLRFHDPCQQGRGLGEYAAPRVVLQHLLGHPVDEFLHTQEDAICAGSGGFVPVTFPTLAGKMAAARVAEHQRAGGGTIVTGCASSGLALRRAGAQVVDWAVLADQYFSNAKL